MERSSQGDRRTIPAGFGSGGFVFVFASLPSPWAAATSSRSKIFAIKVTAKLPPALSPTEREGQKENTLSREAPRGLGNK